VSESVFFERFSEWKRAMQQCTALRKTAGLFFCFYTGQPCAFVNCPRRIYEKELKEEAYVPLEDRLKQLRESYNSLRDTMNIIKGDVDSLKELVKKLAEKESAVQGNP